MKNFHLLTLSCYDSDSNSSYDTVYPVVTDDMPGFMASLAQRARTQWAQLKEVQQKRPAAPGPAYTEWFNEYDALTSFAFNVGTTAFCSSTLVKKLNAADYEGACGELRRWVYVKGKKSQGLVNRREKEYRQCIAK